MMNKLLETYLPKIVSEVKGFAIFMMDQKGTILTWNIGCELMKGYKEAEAIGQNYRILFPDFLREQGLPEHQIQVATETGRYETENWRRTKTGKLFWAFVILTKVTDEDGNFVGFIKITQDQSEKKKFHDQLQSKIEEFKKINADLNNFAHTASHDLKAPINNLEALTIMLKEELAGEKIVNKEVYHIVDLIHQSALKFKDIIIDMATSVKEEADDYTYQSFKDEVEEIRMLLIKDIEKNQVIFQEDYTEAPFIRYPRKHIRSILQNLITNAIKYRSPERRPLIRIKTTHAEGYTVLEVSDNGIGIKEEDKNRVFAMYQRLEEGKKEEGTGVGLGLVAKIVDGNKGKIEIESKVNVGTTFKIFMK